MRIVLIRRSSVIAGIEWMFLATGIAAVLIAPERMAAQAASAQPSQKKNEAPKIKWRSDGHPDFEGVWNFATITPLERPTQFADKEVLTDAEVKALEADAAQQRVDPPSDRKIGDASEFGAGRAYNQFWRDPGTKVVGTKRTSLIVDPPDGRLPPVTSEAAAKKAARAAAASGLENPEGLNNSTRCLVGFNSGPPMVPGAYNNYVQIVQTPAHVAIFNEMATRPRVIPVTPRPLLRIPQWQGNSTARWEGNSLVVRTIDFMEKAAFMDIADANLRVTERFTPIDGDTLSYRVTVEDPTVWASSWTMELSMTRTDDHIYEYACHEGNYAMKNTLSAARAGDKR